MREPKYGGISLPAGQAESHLTGPLAQSTERHAMERRT